jgi:hypothetical protein
MARLIDNNSKRQRGFRILNQIGAAAPSAKLQRLMSELKVDRPYAETIIATHRREGKKTGKYVTVFSVLDQRNGKPCSPYLSSHIVFKTKVKKSDALTASAAKAAYLVHQEAKINLVKEL